LGQLRRSFQRVWPGDWSCRGQWPLCESPLHIAVSLRVLLRLAYDTYEVKPSLRLWCLGGGLFVGMDGQQNEDFNERREQIFKSVEGEGVCRGARGNLWRRKERWRCSAPLKSH
jgi:hypothetical protein